jgi:hypothetical protein
MNNTDMQYSSKQQIQKVNNRKLIILKQIAILFILILVSTSRLFAQEQKVWEQLDLNSTRIAGTTIYYEKSLEQKLPVFQRIFKDYRNQINTRKKVGTDEKITADIYDIVGQTDFDIAKQLKSAAEISSSLSLENQTFYLFRKETAKDYLRKGGKLPHMSYDKETNMVTQYFGVAGQLKDSKVSITNYFSGDKKLEMLIPVDSKQTFEKDVEKYFGYLNECFSVGIMLHEIIEMSILKRWKPEDPYWRWFSDGFANAITIEILKRHAGIDIADEFAKAYYISEYKPLEKEINLRYWMGLNYCIKTPLEYENELQLARYAYATQEAQRLIEKNGIDCVRKIIDKILTKETRTGLDILQAVNEVTGEDMQKRFDHYQTFETRQEGLAKYGRLFNAVRTLELQESQLSPTGLQCYKEIALLLFKLGHEQAGDQTMQNCVEIFKNSGITMAHDAAMETFIVYAFNCNNAKKAREIADELLKSKPDHVLALTVQMVVHAEDGRISQAKKIAQKVINLDKNEQSPSYRTAIQILGTNAGQQDQDNKP